MSVAKNGDQVKVHYTGKLKDGEQFDSSKGREPLSFTVGAGQMIKGFDAAIPGMKVGDHKTVTIAPAEAYGEVSQDAIIEYPKKNIPDTLEIHEGMKLQLHGAGNQPVTVVVKEVKENSVVLDANHHLAGKELVFDIELVEVNGKA